VYFPRLQAVHQFSMVTEKQRSDTNMDLAAFAVRNLCLESTVSTYSSVCCSREVTATFSNFKCRRSSRYGV
jgi:hypothetical protein